MNPENDQRNAVAVRWDRTRDVRQHDKIFTASLNNLQSSSYSFHNSVLLKTNRFALLRNVIGESNRNEHYKGSYRNTTSYRNKQSDLIPVTAV